MTVTLDDEAELLAELDALTPEPHGLPDRLRRLGYKPVSTGAGWYAPGDGRGPVLLLPLHSASSVDRRNRQLSGRYIGRAAAVAAVLAMVPDLPDRPSLLFLSGPSPLPPGVRAESVISLQGGVVPRLWRNCFGSIDMLIRVAGRAPHPGQPNMAVNAIEGAYPILQALMRLKDDVRQRTSRRPHVSEAPLLPRLSIVAAHGGLDGGALPTLFDVVINRRYDPAEQAEDAIAEIRASVTGAAATGVRVGISVTEHRQALPDPDLRRRSQEDQALADGWGWPQLPFCTEPPLVPDAIPFGGLEHPGEDPAAATATTSMEEIAAFCQAVRALLAGKSGL